MSMKRFRWGIAAVGGLALAVGVLAATPRVAEAQAARPGLATYVPGTMGIPQPEPLVTLSIKQPRSLARVLYELFKQTPFEYQLLADVGTSAFTLEANKQPLTRVLTGLLAQDKRPDPLVFRYERSLTGKGGTFVIDREFIDIEYEDGERRLSLANARITRVLPELFKKMMVQGRVEPDVPPITVSLQLRPEEWEQALPMIMLEVFKKEPALTYSRDGEALVVHLQRTPTGGPLSPLPTGVQPRRVKVNFAETPLKDALAELLKDSAWKYQVSDRVKDFKVTYVTGTDPELVALHTILKQSTTQVAQQVTYREGKGILYIEEGPLPGDFVVPRSGMAAVRRTSLNISMRKLKSVVELISGALNVPITVAPNVPDIPITVRFENADINDALRAIVLATRESLPNLNFRTQGTGFVLELNK